DSLERHRPPLGVDEVRLTKQTLKWPVDPPFLVPERALFHFREALARGERRENEWNELMREYLHAHPVLADELSAMISGELPTGWDTDIPTFSADPKGLATRKASGKVMNAIAPHLTTLTGGSGDLDTSTFTNLEGFGDFNPSVHPGADTQGSDKAGWSYAGRNIHFGVR